MDLTWLGHSAFRWETGPNDRKSENGSSCESANFKSVLTDRSGAFIGRLFVTHDDF